MKRFLGTLVVSASFMTLLSGCDGNQTHISESKSTSFEESSSESNTIFADFVGDYPENPISLLTLSKNEIQKAINAQPNMKCSDKLYINIPESASVYEFSTYGVHVEQFNYPAEQYMKDFEKFFKYFYPNRKINMEYLKYSKYLGENEGYEEGFVKDKEHLPDNISFEYDEMPTETAEWNSPVYIDLRAEIGSGGVTVNKGEAAFLVGKNTYDYMKNELVPTDVYNRLTSFDPKIYFEQVGTYSPQSEKSFKLADGEMKICDAVKFFENYINNAPISTGLQRNMRTSVYNVIVLKINENTYGYCFATRGQFQGVNYEPVVYGSMSAYSYDPIGGEALMIRSDDVDYIRGFYGTSWTFDVKECKSVVPVETAVKIISENLSENVTFEVDTVEFVYVQRYVKDEQGHIDIDTYESHKTPAWRITMHNANDNLEYMCYVDATDGSNFRYYKASNITIYED